MHQKGFAHLLLILILVLIIALAVILFSTGIIKFPGKFQVLAPKSQFKNYYQNPFVKEEVYVNPFSEISESSDTYKNPFENLK